MVNPDDIAKELNPSDPTAARIDAGKETLRRIDLLLGNGTTNVVAQERYDAFTEGICQN